MVPSGAEDPLQDLTTVVEQAKRSHSDRKANRPPAATRPSGRMSEERQKNGIAGWSSPVARQAHNLKVVGSNPTPATTTKTHHRSTQTTPAAPLTGAIGAARATEGGAMTGTPVAPFLTDPINDALA